MKRGKVPQTKRKKADGSAGHDQLNLYFTDPAVRRHLDILRKKWALEGKIPQSTYSAAVGYMAKNFVEIARRPPSEDGSLPLSLEERTRYNILGETFKAVGWIDDPRADLEVLHAALRLLFMQFEREAFLNEFLKSAGRI